MRSILLPLLIVAGLLLAGCTGSPGDGTTATDSPVGEPQEVQATVTTGGVRGVVVDQAIRPIKGALVSVSGNGVTKNVTTDASGTFVVSGLPAGTYLLKGSHPLFQTNQQSVEVEAGVKTPPAVKLQLSAKVTDRPYMTTELFKGFITCSVGGSFVASEECGEGVGIPCTQDPVPCGRTGGQENNNVQYDFYVDGSYVRNIIIEQVWTAASEATGNFYTVAPATNWTCDPVCGGNQIADMAGASPLLSRIEVVDGVAIAHEPIIAAGTFGNQTLASDTRLSTFTWPEWGACGALVSPNDPTCYTQANVATDQEFKLFVSKFYFLPAPDGWALAKGDTNPFV